MRALVRFLLSVSIIAAVLLLGGPAHADSPAWTEHIAQYDVTLTVAKDGTMQAHEVIDYDFGSTLHHGIFRDLVARETYGNDGKYDRVYRIDVQGVRADPGVSSSLQTSSQGNYLRLRIGDPNKLIGGTHRYEIDYTVRGAPTTFADHDELFWDAIGNQWPVPIDHARVTVRMPAAITNVACYAGAQGSRLSCDSARRSGNTATFTDADLSANEGTSVVVAVPKGTIQPPPEPLLEKRWNFNDAFSRDAPNLASAGGIAILGIGAISIIAWRRGRDRRFVGSGVDQALGNTTGAEEPMPVVHDRAGPVEFVPPDGVLPGEVGLLIDEQANLLDVTATIIDLAVRGYIRITELPPEGVFHHRHDYELERLDKKNDPQHPLLAYEDKLLAGLQVYSPGATVKLSDLKYKFRSDLKDVQNALYDDAMKKGWFRIRPDKTRSRWVAAGILVLIAAFLITALLAAKTTYGLVGIAIGLVGIALLIAAHRMPSRTARGSAMLFRIRGFRRLFDEGDEDIRSRFAEQHGIFSQYLPFAIVFGCAKKWAHAFEGLDAEQLGAAGWYSGPGPFNAILLANALDDFGTVATGTLYASQPSSSGGSGFGGGGFSGGGGGGGGGGSW